MVSDDVHKVLLMYSTVLCAPAPLLYKTYSRQLARMPVYLTPPSCLLKKASNPNSNYTFPFFSLCVPAILGRLSLVHLAFPLPA